MIMNYGKLPRNMTLLKAYKAICRWYRANRYYFELLYQNGNKAFTSELLELTHRLPRTKDITEIEMRAILIEVLRGNLEACYHASDGSYAMQAYARAGLTAFGNMDLTQAEVELLKESPLWSSLCYNRSCGQE
jgi:imidazolonepropionase-like amidohydrolase